MTGTNPWLSIPLDDYERHMALPTVGQAQLLRDVLAEAIAVHRPRSVAVLGCAGGNGFDCLPATVERIVGVDINARYVAAARDRFGHRRGVELHVSDLEREPLPFSGVELVYAALLFEYVAASVVLPKIVASLAPGGTLVAVLQLPSAVHTLTPSPYTSLSALSRVITLVAPDELERAAIDAGLTGFGATTVAACGGKRFAVLTFARPRR